MEKPGKQVDYYGDVASQPWLQNRLVFVIGDLVGGEMLRQGLCWRPPNPDWRNQREWLDATFAAYSDPVPSRKQHYNPTWDLSDPLLKVDAQGVAFRYFRGHVEKALLITRQVQEGIRSRITGGNPFVDRYSVPPVFEFGGIIPYNHGLVREANRDDTERGLLPVQRKVLSVVVDEAPSGNSLDSAVAAEFKEGADVFVVGIREPEEYRSLMLAWFSGTINPAKFKGAFFNERRFARSKQGLLAPTHSYEGPETHKVFPHEQAGQVSAMSV